MATKKSGVNNRRAVYIVLGVIVTLFLLGNAGSRTVFRRYWEQRMLKKQIAFSQHEHEVLSREIYVLKNDVTYIERIARKELTLIAPGEVEYRFEVKGDKK